jgi:hypothetical protein
MKKDVKTLIKRLTLLVQLKQTGKGWISIDGSGYTWVSDTRPYFLPSGHSESLDFWNIGEAGRWEGLTDLDKMPLSMVCPSLPSKEALFYTDGETVWLVEVK